MLQACIGTTLLLLSMMRIFFMKLALPALTCCIGQCSTCLQLASGPACKHHLYLHMSYWLELVVRETLLRHGSDVFLSLARFGSLSGNLIATACYWLTHFRSGCSRNPVATSESSNSSLFASACQKGQALLSLLASPVLLSMSLCY